MWREYGTIPVSRGAVRSHRSMNVVQSSVAVNVPAEIAPRRSPILSKLVSCDVALAVGHVPLLSSFTRQVCGTVSAAPHRPESSLTDAAPCVLRNCRMASSRVSRFLATTCCHGGMVVTVIVCNRHGEEQHCPTQRRKPHLQCRPHMTARSHTQLAAITRYTNCRIRARNERQRDRNSGVDTRAQGSSGPPPDLIAFVASVVVTAPTTFPMGSPHLLQILRISACLGLTWTIPSMPTARWSR